MQKFMIFMLGNNNNMYIGANHSANKTVVVRWKYCVCCACSLPLVIWQDPNLGLLLLSN